MRNWFPLVMTVALAAIVSPLHADNFNRLASDTAEASIPLNGGRGGEVIHSSPELQAPAPIMDQHHTGHGHSGYGYVDQGYSSHGPAQTGYGYPFRTGCCETKNACAASLWQGYCSRSHGACDRMQSWFANCARGHGGCKVGCSTGQCGKGGCATGHCGHGGKSFGHVQHGGKGFGHVQHGHVQHKGHVQHAPMIRGHVQRNFFHGGHVQHGKGAVGCNTCGQSPCGCHAKGHHRKGFSFGFHGKHLGHGFGKGHVAADCGCGTGGCGKGGCGKVKRPCRLGGLFSRRHACDTCGKSTGMMFGIGGCDCDGSSMIKGGGLKGGWSQEGSVIWDEGNSYQTPQHGQPTPAYDPPVDLEIPEPVDSLPVPSTPTGHSASLRRLPTVTGYQF